MHFQQKGGVVPREQTWGKRLREGGLEAFLEMGVFWSKVVGLLGDEVGVLFPLKKKKKKRAQTDSAL